MLLLGHRGARASHEVPENTLASFELCLLHGCNGFEFDVRCSSDGVAVICHDPLVRGLRIEHTPSAKLALPTLSEVLDQFSSRAFLDIELKVPGLEVQTIAALQEYLPQQGFVVSSFLPEVLSALHALDPTIPLGFLFDRKNQLPPPDLPLAWLIPYLRLADQDLIERTHTEGRKVMVWTVNRSADIRRLAQLGIDAIISDDTELLVRTFR